MNSVFNFSNFLTFWESVIINLMSIYNLHCGCQDNILKQKCVKSKYVSQIIDSQWMFAKVDFLYLTISLFLLRTRHMRTSIEVHVSTLLARGGDQYKLIHIKVQATVLYFLGCSHLRASKEKGSAHRRNSLGGILGLQEASTWCLPDYTHNCLILLLTNISMHYKVSISVRKYTLRLF